MNVETPVVTPSGDKIPRNEHIIAYLDVFFFFFFQTLWGCVRKNEFGYRLNFLVSQNFVMTTQTNNEWKNVKK